MSANIFKGLPFFQDWSKGLRNVAQSNVVLRMISDASKQALEFDGDEENVVRIYRAMSAASREAKG